MIVGTAYVLFRLKFWRRGGPLGYFKTSEAGLEDRNRQRYVKTCQTPASRTGRRVRSNRGKFPRRVTMGNL